MSEWGSCWASLLKSTQASCKQACRREARGGDSYSSASGLTFDDDAVLKDLPLEILDHDYLVGDNHQQSMHLVEVIHLPVLHLSTA